MHEVRTFAPCKAFLFDMFAFFSSLENYFGFRTTNVKGKTDHSVSLRWNKRFEHFQRGEYFSDNCAFELWVDFRLLSPGWIKTRLYSFISSYGYFFYMPGFLNLPSLCRTSFIPVFSQRTISLTHASELKLVRLKLLGNRRSNLLEKKRVLRPFFGCSNNNSQRFLFFFFFIFYLIILFSVFLYVNFPFHSLWSRERQLPAVTSKWLSLPVNNCWSWIWLKRAKQTLMCSFLYMPNDLVSLISWMKTLAWTSY